MNAEDLKKRTKAFALRILRLAAALPNTIEGRVIRGQLVKAGTSVGANYRGLPWAFQGRICRKARRRRRGSDESAFWLELIIEAEFLTRGVVEPLLREANELVKIMAKSRLSASRALRKTNRQSAMNKNWQSAIGNNKNRK